MRNLFATSVLVWIRIIAKGLLQNLDFDSTQSLLVGMNGFSVSEQLNLQRILTPSLGNSDYPIVCCWVKLRLYYTTQKWATHHYSLLCQPAIILSNEEGKNTNQGFKKHFPTHLHNTFLDKSLIIFAVDPIFSGFIKFSHGTFSQ